MYLGLTAEQAEFQQVVRQFLTDHCTISLLRTSADSELTDDLIAGLAELGAPGLMVRTEHGGLGLDENFLVPVLIESGRAAAPLPLVDTIAVAPAVPLDATYRQEIVAGKRWVAADPQGTGQLPFGGRSALQLRGGWAGTGVISIVDLAEARREPLNAVDPGADLQHVTGGRLIAQVDDPDVVRLAWLRGVLGASAQLIGLGRRMLDMTVSYVQHRHQFGVPVGSFQAVKHQLASALVALEFAEPMVASAGYALAANMSVLDTPLGTDASVDVSTAKALASDAALTIARITLQCHGAIAYTTEYDWQLLAKRAWWLAAAWGSAQWHRDTVARSLELPRSGSAPSH